MDKLKPKLFSVMKGYTKQQFLKDLMSGVIVAIVALPLSIALAIASGVSPEQGLYTAIIAGFIISFLGGSRVQIGGPTGAFMVIVFGIVLEYGYQGLVISTIMAGIILIILGLLRLGSVIKYIPYPITMGFTTGIAVTIFTSQIKDFLGLELSSVPVDFIGKWVTYFTNLNLINWYSVIIGIFTIVVIKFMPKLTSKIPGALVAIIMTSLATLLLNLDVATIGSTFGELSNQLPKLSIPNISLSDISTYMAPAIVIALLGGIESLLSAVVSDGMIGSKHRSNMELIAQGTANIASVCFGGIPATGAIARTVTNVKNGGRTPIAGIVHSIVLLIILVLFMPYAALIPLSSLAGILIVVAYNMSDIKEFKLFFKSPKSDIFVLLVTFLITVLVDLVTAIEIGMVLALFLFMKRMSNFTEVQMKSLDASEDDDVSFDFSKANQKFQADQHVLIYEINGPFFFGAADKFIDSINQIGEKNELIILGLKHVPFMDGTALHGFRRLLHTCYKHHIEVYITGINKQPLEVLQKAGLVDEIGKNHFYKTIEEAKIHYNQLKKN